MQTFFSNTLALTAITIIMCNSISNQHTFHISRIYVFADRYMMFDFSSPSSGSHRFQLHYSINVFPLQLYDLCLFSIKIAILFYCWFFPFNKQRIYQQCTISFIPQSVFHFFCFGVRHWLSVISRCRIRYLYHQNEEITWQNLSKRNTV